MRLDLAQLIDVLLRHLADRLVHRVDAVQPSQLQAVQGLLRPEASAEFAEVQHVPLRTVHQEERRIGAVCLDRYQAGPGSVHARARVAGDERARGVASQQFGEGRHRRRLEEGRKPEVGRELALDAREQPERDQRVPAEGEKVVVDPHRFEPQQLLPPLRQTLLDVVSRLDEAALQRRARDADLRCRVDAQRVGDELIEDVDPDRRDDHLRDRRPREHAPQRVHALTRRDARVQRRVQQVGARSEIVRRRPSRLVVVVRSLVRPFAKHAGPGDATDRERLHLHEDRPVFVHDRHIERGDLIVRPAPGRGAHMAVDATGERPPDPHAAVRERDEQVFGRLVAVEQRKRVARRQVKECGVQRVLFQVLRERLREFQQRQRLVLPVVHGAEIPPARTEAQVALLFGGRLVRAKGVLALATASADRLDAAHLVTLEREVAHLADCVLLPGRVPQTAVRRGLVGCGPAAHRQRVAAAAVAAQRHAHLARAVVGDGKRRQEAQVADLQPVAGRWRPQRCAGEFHVAGTRNERLPVGEPVLVQHPVGGRAQLAEVREILIGIGQLSSEQRVDDAVDERRVRVRPAPSRRLCGHPHVAPEPPAHGHRAASAAGHAVVGEGIEERVRSRVVHLPRRPEQRAARGEQHHPVEWRLPEHAIEHQRAAHLGSEHALRRLRVLQGDQVVVDRSRRVYDAVDLAEAGSDPRQRARHGGLVGHVGAHDQHLRSQLLELPNGRDALADSLLGAVRRQPGVPVRAVGQRRPCQQDEPRARLAGEPLCLLQPQAAQPSRDQIGAALSER